MLLVGGPLDRGSWVGVCFDHVSADVSAGSWCLSMISGITATTVRFWWGHGP